MKITYINAKTKEIIRSEEALNWAEIHKREVSILDVPYKVDGEIETIIPVTLIKEK
jgi:hypothetical protein